MLTAPGASREGEQVGGGGGGGGGDAAGSPAALRGMAFMEKPPAGKVLLDDTVPLTAQIEASQSLHSHTVSGGRQGRGGGGREAGSRGGNRRNAGGTGGER